MNTILICWGVQIGIFTVLIPLSRGVHEIKFFVRGSSKFLVAVQGQITEKIVSRI